MMSAPSSAMCCTYGAPLMMPLQFQDWTQIEESNGEDVHVTAVTDLLGFIISEVEDWIVRFLTLSTSVLRRDNSRFTSSRSWPHWSDVAVLLRVRISLLKDVISCLSRLISLVMKLLATELFRLLWEYGAGGDNTLWVSCSTESGGADRGGFLVARAALLILSRSALLLFPFLTIVLGNLVLFSILEIISHISSASLWFSGLVAEPLLSTRMSLGSGTRSCLAASSNSSRRHTLREAIGWRLSDDTNSSLGMLV